MALRNDESILVSNVQAIRHVFLRARREGHLSPAANDVRKTVQREFSLMEQAHARIRTKVIRTTTKALIRNDE